MEAPTPSDVVSRVVPGGLGLLVALVSIGAASYQWLRLLEGGAPLPAFGTHGWALAAVATLALAAGLLGAGGALLERPRPLLAAAALLGAAWLLHATWRLADAMPHGNLRAALAGDVVQSAAALALGAGAYLVAADAYAPRSDVPPAAKAAAIGLAALVGASMALGNGAFPDAPAPAATAALAGAITLLAIDRRRTGLALTAAAIALHAATLLAATSTPAERSVALVSYVVPHALALAPLAAVASPRRPAAEDATGT